MKITNFLVMILFIIIIITIQVASSLSSSSELKPFDTKQSIFESNHNNNNESIIDCGVKNKMYGLSILDNNLYQFENCSVIIYSNIAEHFVTELPIIILNNGTRYQFQLQIQSINESYCLPPPSSSSSSTTSTSTLSYSMIRLNNTDHKYHNHILLYFIIRKQNTIIDYKVYNFNLRTNFHQIRQHYNPNIHYIMIVSNQQHFIIHNDYYNHDGSNNNGNHDDDQSNFNQFQLIKDPLIYNTDNNKPLGIFCVYFNPNLYQTVIVLLQINGNHTTLCKSWFKTKLLFEQINLSITYDGKLYLISKHLNLVYVIDENILSTKNQSQEFPLITITINNFFVCKKPKLNDGDDVIFPKTFLIIYVTIFTIFSYSIICYESKIRQ